MENVIESKWGGKKDYSQSLSEQKQMHQYIAEKQPHKAVVLGYEHPTVITLGRRGVASEDVRISDKELQDKFVTIVKISRGGHATLHNPGQLVVYPIVAIKEWGYGVRDFVQLLEKTTQDLLLRYNVETYKKHNDPGLYTSHGKIAFFGLSIKKWTSFHGVSINIKNSLEDFQWIRSCAIDNETFDKLENYQSRLQLETLFYQWCDIFKGNITCQKKNVSL